jgi:hypothetical protein
MDENQEHQCVPVEVDESGIPLKKTTIKKLEMMGRMYSTYDSVITELLSHVDTCNTFWEKR